MVSKVFNSDFYKFFTDYKLILILLYCIQNYIFCRYLLLEILSQYANRLIFSIYNELYRCKETNWKQKKEETPRMQTRDNKN